MERKSTGLTRDKNVIAHERCEEHGERKTDDHNFGELVHFILRCLLSWKSCLHTVNS